MALVNLRDLQVHDADESSFGVDESGSFSARSVRCVAPPKLTVDRQALANPAIRQRLAAQLAPILGLKNASKLALAVALRGTGTAAGDGVGALGAADLAECQLLENAFGGESKGTGTDVNDVAATTTGCTVTSAAGLAEGQAVLVTLSTGLEATVISDITGNDLTFSRALSAAPADEAVIYAGTTYYPSETLAGSLQFQGIGSEDQYFRMLGCQVGSFKIGNLNPGQLPQLDYDIMAASWAEKSGASLADASYSNTVNPPIPGYASTLMAVDVGSSTRTVINYNTLTLDPGITAEKIPGASGAVEGVQAYGRSGIAPKLELTTNPHAAAWLTDFEGPTAKQVHLQLGSTAGQTVLIEMQNAYLVKVPERAAINSQLGIKLVLEGRELTTIATTELARAALRVHLL